MKTKPRIIPVLLSLAACLVASPLRAATINVPGDYPTIQASITAAAPGDTIQVAAGVYQESSGGGNALLVDEAVTIIGAGPATYDGTGAWTGGTLITRGPGAGGQALNQVVAVTADGVTMRQLTVDGRYGFDINAQAATNYGVFVSGQNFTFEDAEVLDPTNSGIELNNSNNGTLRRILVKRTAFAPAYYAGFDSGLRCVDSENLVVDDFEANNVKRGIVVFQGYNSGRLEDITIVGNGSTAGRGILFSTATAPGWWDPAWGNYEGSVTFTLAGHLRVSNTGTGVFISDYLPTKDITLTVAPAATFNFHGDVTNGGQRANQGGVPNIDAVMADMGLTQKTAGPPDLYNYPVPIETYVDDNWAGSPPSGSVGGHVFGYDAFATIADALAAVADAGTVHVAAGGYTQALLITRPVTLLGPQADVDPVTGGRPGGEAVLTLNSLDHPLQIVADGVTVNGFEITGFFYGPEIQFAAEPNAQRSDIALTYNYIHSDRCWTGFVIGESVGSGNKNASGNCLVSDVTIANNIVDINVNNRPGYTYNRAFSFTTGFPRLYGTNSVIYRDITIAGNSVNFSGPNGPNTLNETAIFAGGGTSSTEAEFRFENFQLTDNLFSNFRTAMNAMNIHGGMIDGNTFSNIRYGLYVNLIGTAVDPFEVSDNVFQSLLTGCALNLAGTDYAPQGSAYVEITGNTFNYNEVVYTSLYPAVWLDADVAAASVVINDNSFLDGGENPTPGPAVQNDSGTGTVDASQNYWGSPTPDFAAILEGPGAYYPYYSDAARTILVYPVTNTNTGLGYVTIQAALAAAASGNTITVAAGTYTGDIGINQGVTLLGANAGIDPNTGTRGAESIVDGSGGSRIRISTTEPVRVDGFTLSGLILDSYTADSKITYQYNIIAGLPGNMFFNAPDTFVLNNNHIYGTAADWDTLLLAGDWNGTTGTTVTIQGNVLDNAPTAAGLNLSSVTGTISGNKFEGIAYYSLLLANDTNVEVHHNLFDGIVNPDPSVATWGAGVRTYTPGSQFGMNVHDNTFSDSHVGIGVRSGSDLTGKPVTITANTFSNNAAHLVNQGTATSGLSPAGNNVFDGVTLSAATTSQLLALSDRVLDVVDVPTYGPVTLKAGNIYVTANSFRAPDTSVPSIQRGITAAATSDSVLVGPGTFTGNVSIGKALTLSGNGSGSTTLIGVNDTALGTLQVLPNAGLVTIEGLSVIGIDGPPGLEKAAVYLQGNQSGVTIRNNTITANGDAALMAEWGVTVSDLTIEDNLINGSTFNAPGTGGTAGDQFTTPNWPRSLVYIGGPNKSNVVFTGNTVDGVSGDSNNSNVMVNLDAAGTEIAGNTFDGDTGSRPGVAMLRARGSNTVIEENTFTGQSSVAVVIGSGSSDTAATSSVQENGFIAPFDAALNNAGASALDATHNFWGAATGPQGDGSPVTGNVAFSPWYADEARTILATAESFESVTVPAGETVVETDLYIGGGTYTVNGGLEVTGELTLAEGATLEVVNGSLTIDGSTLSGTFTFFNSFGSVDFNGDVTISGSSSGLILVSDVHVADGVTITVNGKLVIDGCVIDCQTEGGSYDIVVNSGASFTMARSVMVDGTLNLAANDSKVYDNRFETSTIGVAAGTAGARVYHNLTDSLGWLADNSAGTVTSVDGWGNITDAAATENTLILGLDLGVLDDLTNGRTTDLDGNIYIQPSDAITASLDVGDLQSKIAAVEVLLGYNTGLFAASPLALESDWNELISGVDDDASVIGKLDAAIGLSFNFPDMEGTDSDQTIATIGLTCQGVEGESLFFQRVKLAGDTFGGDTRLTTGGASPSYLTPFTANSASIFIDGTAPTVWVNSSVNATQTQESGTVDVLDPAPTTPPAYVHRNGQPLVMSFTAQDTGLAGLDALDSTNDLQLSATNGTTTLNSWTVSAIEDPLTGVVTYTVTLAVPTSSTNGVYTVTAAVRDRSGNWSPATALGAFEITYEMLATVQLQGFVGSTREVVFVATDSIGAVLDTWTKTLTFTGDTATTVLDAVPAATVGISAKTAWNLRSKVAVSLIEDGIGTAVLTGADQLRGGDLNGDNVVNTLDYSTLRFLWLSTSPVADVNGSGAVNLSDYNIQKGNFYSAGDPQ